jgi:hypothetical protein
MVIYSGLENKSRQQSAITPTTTASTTGTRASQIC